MKYFICFILGGLITLLVVSMFFFSSSGFEIGNEIQFKSNKGGFEFTAMPSKGRDYQMMERAFKEYKLKMNLDENVHVYRVTKRNYFKFSRWCAYRSMPEWNYPYRSL